MVGKTSLSDILKVIGAGKTWPSDILKVIGQGMHVLMRDGTISKTNEIIKEKKLWGEFKSVVKQAKM